MFNTHITLLRFCGSYGGQSKKQNSNSRAFTIIELLVVIAIIGLISSVVLVSMKGSTGKARIAKGLEFSQTLMNVIGVDAVGIWTFDEGSGGTAFDKSGYGNHGTFVGDTHFVEGEENTPHWYVNEGEGRFALDFDGSGDYVNCGQGSSLNITTAATIEMWINSSVWATSETPLYNGLYYIYHRGAWAGDRVYFLYRINGGSSGDSAWGGWAGVRTSTQLATDRWYHIVGTMSGDNMKIYVNSKMERELDCLTGQTINNSGFGDLIIGQNNFNGLIDEVRVYARALNSAEIQQHYVDGAEKHQLVIND